MGPGVARTARAIVAALYGAVAVVLVAPRAEALCVVDAETRARADDLERTLRTEAARARSWRYAWGAAYDGLALATFAVLPVRDLVERDDLAVTGISAALAGGLVLALRLDVERADVALADLNDAAPCDRVFAIDELYRRYGSDEALHVAWPSHALNVIANSIVGGVIAFGFHHGAYGVYTAASGLAIAEVRLLSQPKRLIGGPPGIVFALSLSPA